MKPDEACALERPRRKPRTNRVDLVVFTMLAALLAYGWAVRMIGRLPTPRPPSMWALMAT